MKVSSIVQTRRPMSHFVWGPVALLALVGALAVLVSQQTPAVAQTAAVSTAIALNCAGAAGDSSVPPASQVFKSRADTEAPALDFWTF